MFDQFHPKRGLNFFTFSGLLLVMLVSLVCSFPAASLAEEAAKAPVKTEAPATPNPKDAPCQGLKPFSNLEELLYQFYINSESDCLFEMPVEELEKKWDIKILSEERSKPKNYYPLSEIEFYNKPYKSKKDAFYVEIVSVKKIYINERIWEKFNERIFLIKMTKKYLEKCGSLDSKKEGCLQNIKIDDLPTKFDLSIIFIDATSEIMIIREN